MTGRSKSLGHFLEGGPRPWARQPGDGTRRRRQITAGDRYEWPPDESVLEVERLSGDCVLFMGGRIVPIHVVAGLKRVMPEQKLELTERPPGLPPGVILPAGGFSQPKIGDTVQPWPTPNSTVVVPPPSAPAPAQRARVSGAWTAAGRKSRSK